MKNFIPINRKLFNHFFWNEKRKFSKFEAWLDLLQLVSFSDNNKLLISGKLCEWDRGQYPISISFLGKRWYWGDKQVRNYLKLLESEQMIDTLKTGKWTMLTICKYEDYNTQGQADEPQKGQSGGNQGAGSGQQLNKDKKGKEDKKGKDMVYSKEIHDCLNNCLSFFPEHLHPETENIKNSWLDTLDKLKRLDKIPLLAIEEIVKKTREDSFWSNNFLSITKLRKNDNNGVKYIVVFNEKIKSNGQIGNRKSKGATHGEIQQVFDKHFGKS